MIYSKVSAVNLTADNPNRDLNIISKWAPQWKVYSIRKFTNRPPKYCFRTQRPKKHTHPIFSTGYKSQRTQTFLILDSKL